MSKKYLIILITLIVITVGVIIAWFVINKINTDSITYVPNYNKQLNNELKTTFSTNYPDIISDTEAVSSESDPAKQYQQYILVFNKMAKAYQETKNPKIRFSMIQLKSYLRGLPQYNEAELVIPK